ncbi:hypothetical protein [Streptomyces brasiliscabiei]|uniref:hypothetical protein n=1 Tax=Streptomyces brasiliscabiei TaxID=2736302 RepID=UPI001C12253F|nr:hypothetical protein [Streptomyces brasiliscabiei]
MASLRGSRPHEPHPVFAGVFRDWHAQAGVFSALPDAPVEPDAPRPWWRRPRLRRAHRLPHPRGTRRTALP